MANTPNYEIDPNDSRLTAVKNEEKTELSNLEKTYADMQTNTDEYYDKLTKGWDQYEKDQTDLQKQRNELTIQGTEQDIDDLKKDYTKEQSGAYVDWQKQSNQYGTESEKMAATGLANTGFSESSQVSMYNQYQNRVAVARESFIRAETDFKNQIAEAKLQNSSILAEIAFNTLQKKTELAIEQAQYKNQLLQDFTTQKAALKQTYLQRYQNVLNQMQAEIDAAKNVTIGDYYDGNSGVVKTSETSAKSGSTAGNAKIQQTANKGVQIEGGYEVNTPYYQGKKNPDCAKYGTFSNGYQPKGISGHGKLTDSGDTITIETQTLKGHQNKVVQTVWKASDGSLWYWDGRKNSYVRIVGSTAWKTKLGSKLKQEHSIN